MKTNVTNYANGTQLVTRAPWGTFVGGRALCADGKVRALKRISATADTFFSVPASVTVNGKTVAGYVTVNDTLNDSESVVEFRAYTYRKNHNAFAEKRKMKTEQQTLWFCTDCALIAETGDATSLDYHYEGREADKRLREIENGLRLLGPVATNGEENEFSTRVCDCCGSQLAGHRTGFVQMNPQQ